MRLLNLFRGVWASWFQEQRHEDISCPVCGYYCLGRGGMGCIDKPFIVLQKESVIELER